MMSSAQSLSQSWCVEDWLMVVSYLIIFICLRWLFHLWFVHHFYALNFYFLSFLSCVYLFNVLQSRFSHYLKDPAVSPYSSPTRRRYLKLQHKLFCPAASEIYLWIREKKSRAPSCFPLSSAGYVTVDFLKQGLVSESSPWRRFKWADSWRWKLSTSEHTRRRRQRDADADGRLLIRRSFIFFPP